MNHGVEVVLIASAPKYVLDKGGKSFTKEMDIQEFRFFSGLSGINLLIGELQALVVSVNNFEQLAASLNVVIESSKKEQAAQK